MLIGLFAGWIICTVVLSKGVKHIGKAMYFIAIYPYVAITILVIRSVTLPGAAEGILFYLIPDPMRLLDITVWSDAATQIFFSLGICQGSLLTMSSFNNFHDNVLRNAVTVSIINCVTSFYVGFAVFTILGFLAHEYQIPIDRIVTSGSSLVFILYPTGLTRLSVSPLWSVIWFLMMVMVGIGSQIGCFETVLAPLSDRYTALQRRQVRFRLIACLVGFLFCIPMICNGGMHLLDIVNTYSGGVNLLILALFELIAIAYIYSAKRLCEDIGMMMMSHLNPCWKVFWRYLTPLYLTFISILWIINYSSNTGTPHEPRWASTLGWLISLSTLLPLVAFAIYVWVRMAHLTEAIYISTKPLWRWGPVLPENRVGRYAEAEKVEADESLIDEVIRMSRSERRFKPNRVTPGSVSEPSRTGDPVALATAEPVPPATNLKPLLKGPR